MIVARHLRAVRPTLVLTLALSLAACASRPVITDVPWSVEQASHLSRFIMHAKVGFRRGETGGSAALVWQQDGVRYRMLANGPLGQGSTRITGDESAIRIENSEGSRESADPAGLLAEAIGWPVSVESLSFWARGLALPGTKAEVETDPEGHPAHIHQQDWDIVLDRWHGSGGFVMPHRVVATGGESRVTLLIERWDFGPVEQARITP